MESFKAGVQSRVRLEKLKLEHLYGTSGYLFVGTYRGRSIQFESTHLLELSDSLGNMVSRAERIIDVQADLAGIFGGPAPKYAIYPELLEQKENFHLLYEYDFLRKEFAS